jgi:hypothetical protein
LMFLIISLEIDGAFWIMQNNNMVSLLSCKKCYRWLL